MEYMEAPNRLHRIPLPLIFLSGGISNCSNWQRELLGKLDPNLPGTVCNPRRENFDVNDPTLSKAQIEWEFEWLWRSQIVTIWFCKETLCPITLLELGEHLVRSRLAQVNRPRLCVGIEPGYARAFDVRLQTKLVDPNIPIVDNLDDIAKFIAENSVEISKES